MHGPFIPRSRRLRGGGLLGRLGGLVVLASALSVASPALAGPYAGAAMGEAAGRGLRLPTSLHLGGALGAGLGPLGSEAELGLRIEGALELQISDFMGLGLVVGSQGLPDVFGRGERATTVGGRLRVRYPLLGQRSAALHRTVVPLLSLAVDAGGGWISDPPADADDGLGTIGVTVGLDLVVLGRVTPFVSLGYRQQLMSGPDLRQLEAHVGVSVRLFGDTDLGPRPPPEPRPERESRGRVRGEELCDGARPGSFRARLCAEVDDDDEES